MVQQITSLLIVITLKKEYIKNFNISPTKSFFLIDHMNQRLPQLKLDNGLVQLASPQLDKMLGRHCPPPDNVKRYHKMSEA